MYTKENVYWALPAEQSRNSRAVFRATLNGQTKTVNEWCAELRLPSSTVYRRIKEGMSPEDAIQNL
jgi:hypothetical protein